MDKTNQEGVISTGIPECFMAFQAINEKDKFRKIAVGNQVNYEIDICDSFTGVKITSQSVLVNEASIQVYRENLDRVIKMQESHIENMQNEITKRTGIINDLSKIRTELDALSADFEAELAKAAL